MEERYDIEVNRIKYSYLLRLDMTEPCPVCGAPACGQEEILWYQSEDDKIALVYDGGTFSGILESYLSSVNYDELPYADLPQFIRDWNEGKGWEEAIDSYGTRLDNIDLGLAMNLVEEFCKKDNELAKEQELIKEFQKTLKACLKEGSELYIAK